MKLKIRKIKKEEENKKPFHVVNLKIFKNQKDNKSIPLVKKQIKEWTKYFSFFLEYVVFLQKLIYKTKKSLQNLMLFKKIKNEFSQSKEALFFYSKKIFSPFKKTKISQTKKEIIKIPEQNKLSKPPLIIQQNKTVFKIPPAMHFFYIFLNQCNALLSIIIGKLSFLKLLNFIKNQFSTFKCGIKSCWKIFSNHSRHNVPLKIHFGKKEFHSPIKILNSFLRRNDKKIFNWKFFPKPILIFILIILAFILSFNILFLTQKSKNITEKNKKELNILELTNNVNLSNFTSNYLKLNKIIEPLPANSKNRALFKAEKYLSEAEKYLIAALNDKQIKKQIVTEQIIDWQNNLSIALPKIQIANYYLTQVNLKTIVNQNRNEFNQIKIYLSKLENNIQELLEYSKMLSQILGQEKKQRYLVILQDDNKMRPTGGFIENFILIDVSQGIIKKVEMSDIAYPQKKSIQSPYPLNLINPTWQEQDANWFFDFPSSAQKIIWFYQKLRGSKKIDGVISLNASLIPKILKFVGPIKMLEYSTTINDENFLKIKKQTVNLKINEQETQTDLLLNINQENINQENIISDFIPQLLNKILSPQNNSEQSLKILEIVNEALSKKDIMFYSNNFDLQKNILQNNWAGEIKSINNGDYLAVVNINVNQESDENIKQLVDLQTQILDDGTIINTTKVTRIYSENQFINSKNLNYIKLYVPKGSVLLEIKGFKKLPITTFSNEYSIDADLSKIQKQTLIDEETNTRISQEFNKTVFGNWIETTPEKSTTIAFKYKLPFKLQDLKINKNSQGFFQKIYKKTAQKFNLINETLPYQILIQKQSGKKDELWKYSINLPVDWRLVWQNFPIDFMEKDGQIKFDSFLDQDQLWTMLLKKVTNN